MKIRLGFVSNSSSSSYTCDICGHLYAGFDVSIEDGYMAMCENGHIFCIDCLTEKERKKFYSFVEKVDKEDNLCIDANYSCPSRICPLCNFREVANRDIVRWLLYEALTTENLVAKKIKLAFTATKKSEVPYDKFNALLKAFEEKGKENEKKDRIHK